MTRQENNINKFGDQLEAVNKEIKKDLKEAKSKSELKKEIKEKKSNEAKCLFCVRGFGWDIRDIDKIKTTKPTPQAFLICANCITGGDLPTNQDLKIIRQGWEKGGLLLTNIKKVPRPENLLIQMIEESLERGVLRVYWEDGKVYLENTCGGITIELNIYRNSKNEDK